MRIYMDRLSLRATSVCVCFRCEFPTFRGMCVEGLKSSSLILCPQV